MGYQLTHGADVGPGSQTLWLEPAGLDAADRTAWSDLADRALEPNPFLRPEFVLANVEERGATASLIVIRDGPRWVACLPVRRRAPSLRLPIRRLETSTDAYTLCGTPLIDRDSVDATTDALMDVLRAERRAGVLVMGMLPSDGPVRAALVAAAERHGMRPSVLSDYERAAWHRTTDGGFPGPAFNRSDRRELARRTKLLAAEIGGPLEIVDRTAEPEAWDAFLEMENSGWKAERGTALGSTLTDAAFFRRMCAGMSAAGRLELVALEGRGRTVAMECHLIEGGVHYSFKIAHAPAFRKFSPGTQLKYRVIERFEDQGLTLADSCAVAQNAHMNRLWPGRRRMETLLLPTGAFGAHLVRPTLWARATARRLRDTTAQLRWSDPTSAPPDGAD